jgi:SAM-dependent methyltransferase
MTFTENKNPKCILCDSSSVFLTIKDSFQHFECSNNKCQLIFVYPPPRDLKKVYKNNLGIESNKSSSGSLKLAISNTLNISLARKLIIPKQNWQALDIGCRDGNFMRGIEDRCKLVIGIEPNDIAADYCRRIGLIVRNEFFSVHSLQDQKFDLINISDVIEHVENPKKMLQDAVSLLMDNGYILIRTPNLRSLWSRQTFFVSKLLEIPWSSLTPPEHISNFSQDGLINLIKAENLLIVSIHSEPPSLFYELGQLHLLRDFRRRSSLYNFMRLTLGYTLYFIIFIATQSLRPFLRSNFSMLIVAKKRNFN